VPGFDRQGKINTAYVVGESNDYPGGGGALAKKTVSDFLGHPVDYYVKINFDGFMKAIDLIGGIDVDVPKTIHDELYPTIDYGYSTFHIDAGLQHLDGETALKYVRTRSTDDDFHRARRQQQVLMAAKDRVIENKLLTTLRVFDLMEVMADSIEHDIPAAELLELASLASRVEIDGIDQLVIDDKFGEVDPDSPFGWVLLPDHAKIQPAIDTLFATTATKTEPQVDLEALARQQAVQQAELARQQVRYDYQAQAETMRRQLAAEGARVIVYDGAGDPAMAARAADWLRGQGYDVVDSGQADRTDYSRTVLLAHNEKPITISNLRSSFAIADQNIRYSNNSQSNVDLRLTIGRDFYLLVSN
jgi:LCP family protein required for cell wall assembly